MSTLETSRPRIALTFGDPAGVGPELVARLLADPAAAVAADILLIGDEQELRDAMDDAGVEFDWTRERGAGVPTLVENGGARPEGGFVRGEPSRSGGLWAMASLRTALELSKDGDIDAIVFAPLNKSSLHLAGMEENDEMAWFETILDDGTTATELNILPELVTGRVTSHCSIVEVADLITFDLIVERGELLERVLRSTRTRANPGSSDATRSTSSRRRSRSFSVAASTRRAHSRVTRSSSRPATGSSTACSPCTTTRARSR